MHNHVVVGLMVVLEKDIMSSMEVLSCLGEVQRGCRRIDEGQELGSNGIRLGRQLTGPPGVKLASNIISSLCCEGEGTLEGVCAAQLRQSDLEKKILQSGCWAKMWLFIVLLFN